MTPQVKKRLLVFVGYPAFFSVAFVTMLYLTFPYQMVAERISTEAARQRVTLDIGSLGPAFFGFKAKKVAITPPKQEGQPKEPEPITIDEVVLRPSLIPLGVGFNADIFGGKVAGSFSPMKRSRLVLAAKGVDLAKANAKAAVGLDLGGKLGADVDVAFDPTDYTKMVGRVKLDGDGLIVNGGTVANYDLPKVDLGKLDGELKIGEGKATVQRFEVKGNDVEATIDGEIGLAQKLAFSTLALKVHFKPAEDFLKRNSFIQTGLNFAMTRDSKGMYNANVDRFLGSPRFMPIR